MMKMISFAANQWLSLFCFDLLPKVTLINILHAENNDLGANLKAGSKAIDSQI